MNAKEIARGGLLAAAAVALLYVGGATSSAITSGSLSQISYMFAIIHS